MRQSGAGHVGDAAAADVAICGGGPVGMSLALALTAAGRSCILLDARPGPPDQGAAAGNPGNDLRTLALSYGSRLVLERIGVWAELKATPVLEVQVSQQSGFGRTVLSANDEGVPALGYVIAYSELENVLRRACARRVHCEYAAIAGTGEIDERAGTGNENHTDLAYLQSGTTRTLQAQLIALADGAQSAGEHAGSAARVERDYGQTAIVADVSPAEPHRNRAWERFAQSGPIALLPKGSDYALVWSLAPKDAEELMLASDAVFLDALALAMGPRVGRMLSVSARGRFPLSLRYRRNVAGKRTIVLGNAAQTLHPVAGQGLNLGLRDVWALTTALAGETDCGDAGVLSRYARSRRVDRRGTIGMTDLLARVFTVDSSLVRAGRGAALTLFDLLPPARHFLARRMIYGASALP